MNKNKYRIIEASIYLDGSKPYFFPQENQPQQKTKGIWWWKKYFKVDCWKYLQNLELKRTSVINDEKKINMFNSDSLVCFKTLSEAESWLRRYIEMKEKESAEYLDNHYKASAISLDKKEVKIHEI